jgi:probable phosphoglycerate mutase
MSVPAQQVFLVRHGETEWSLNGRHTGTTDIPLTENGRHEASELRSILAKESFALALSSPLLRARETCELAGFGDMASIEPDLVEWNYGRFEGMTLGEIDAIEPGWVLFRDGSPGGEKPEEIGARVDRVIEKARAAEGDVILFAHGHVLRVFAARWLGLVPLEGQRFFLDTGAISIVSSNRGAPAIKRWNAPVRF